jgi:tetratricopeptide (TPR) repeat protein
MKTKLLLIGIGTGLWFNSISDLAAQSAPASAPSEPATPATVLAEPAVPAPPRPLSQSGARSSMPAERAVHEFTVGKGQTLYDIIKAYNDEYRAQGKGTIILADVLKVNPNLQNSNRLIPGRKIFIPEPEAAAPAGRIVPARPAQPQPPPVLVPARPAPTQPVPGPATPRPGPSRELRAAILEEERDGNLEPALRRYQEIIRQFDEQREEAAQAIFRLAEVYRKLGRIEEAKVQYARILREFPDQTQLAQVSLQHLAQRIPGVPPSDIALGVPTPAVPEVRRQIPSRGIEEVKRLIDQEMELLEQQLAIIRRQIESGRQPPGAEIQIQREILGLKRQKAELESRGELIDLFAPRSRSEGPGQRGFESLEKQKELLAQEIALVEKQLADTETLVNQNLQPQSALIPLQREILSLKQQSAQLESGLLSPSSRSPWQPPASDSVWAGEKARETAQKNACLNNLRQLDGAKEQWALEHRKNPGDVPTRKEIADFISGGFPVCPAGGTYDLGALGEPPRCSLEDQGHQGHTLQAQAATPGLQPQLQAIVRAGTPNEKERELRNQLVALKAQQAQLEGELRVKEILLESIDARDPATLPVEMVPDPLFQQLKEDYQRAYLAGDDAGVTQLGDKMLRWLSTFKIPELRMEEEAIARKKQALESQVRVIERALEEETKKRD